MKYFALIVVLGLWIACAGDDPTLGLRQAIVELEQRDPADVDDQLLWENYGQLASMINPLDSAYDRTLWNKAELENKMGLYERSLESFMKLHTTSTNTSTKRKSLFMGGFIADEKLNQDSRAESIYLQYLSLYPSGEQAEEVRTLVELLGKSNEEALDYLQKKGAENP